MPSSVGYALDLLTPVRHVATELERVAPAALSAADLASTWSSVTPGDLYRVKRHEGCKNDGEARQWVIKRAVEEFRVRGKNGETQIEIVDGKYRLAVPFNDLRYERRPIIRLEDEPESQFNNAFSPLSGVFSDSFGIKAKRMDTRHTSFKELRESLRLWGWRREMPGVVDERGVIIVGHRRWALCDDLYALTGDEKFAEHNRPMIKIEYSKDFDAGDPADRERYIAAIYSNVGAKPLTEEEWKEIARHMRAEGHTLQAIAEVLQKPIVTVFREVSEVPFSKTEKAVDSLGRPTKGRGRPRKDKTKGYQGKLTPRQQAQIEELFKQNENQSEISRLLEIPRKTVEPFYNVLRTRKEVAEAAVEEEQEPVTEEAVLKQDEPLEEPPTTTVTCPVCGHVHVCNAP